MSNLNGIEIEEKCISIFQNLGWDVERNASNMLPYDLILKINGNIEGYVDCFFASNPRMQKNIMKTKIENVKRIVDIDKPSLYFLTNGEFFDAYYGGKFFATLTNPPSLNSYSLIKRLTAYNV